VTVDWHGVVDSECGEHRTTGLRAWCYACTTWCYPEDPCPGCDHPRLLTEIARLGRVREAATVLVEMIERFRPLDGAFGSPNPFRLIEAAQDDLRAALAALDEK
jgi:hypothetical protein